MSNFDEKVVDRIKRLEREVERLRVKERPVGGVTDHGALSGLGDDDHPQYLLTTAKAADSAKLEATTPSTDGLAMLSAANVAAQRNLLGIKFTTLAQIADDAAISFTPPNSSGFFIWRKSSGSNGGALVAYDAISPTSYTVLIAGTAIMAATTGELKGTTGTDGKITISAHTDGKIYIENRSGTALYSSYVCL